MELFLQLKAVSPRSFHGHPASFHWYQHSPELGPVPEMPQSGTRIATEKNLVKQLVPYAVIFPYIRMGRSITGFNVDRTQGKFGPFENQLFLGDYTQSILMRATTEKVNGVWQGACYPFREGLSTGILNVEFTPGGKLLCGGTNEAGRCEASNRSPSKDSNGVAKRPLKSIASPSNRMGSR